LSICLSLLEAKGQESFLFLVLAHDIPQGTLMKGVSGYREVFVRPVKSGKQVPYTCGLSV